MGLSPIAHLWKRGVRCVVRWYFQWALAEINPLHEDVPMIVRRINELESQ